LLRRFLPRTLFLGIMGSLFVWASFSEEDLNKRLLAWVIVAMAFAVTILVSYLEFRLFRKWFEDHGVDLNSLSELRGNAVRLIGFGEMNVYSVAVEPRRAGLVTPFAVEFLPYASISGIDIKDEV